MQTPSPSPALHLPAQGGGARLPDPCGELEEIVGRLAKLVIHADALAARRPTGTIDDELGRRLLAGADLGRRALAAAMRIDVP